MSTFTDARHALAAAIAAAVSDSTAVSAAPGANLTAPGVYVMAGDAEAASGCLWGANWVLQLVGPGGDNEAGLAGLELLAAQVALAVRNAYPDAQLVLDAPSIAVIGGASTLVQNCTATILLPMEV
jgi:hypothetical protein